MADPIAIDIHTHVVPERFPAYTGTFKDIAWPSMAPAEPCHCNVMIQGKNYRTVHQSCWLNEDRLADMNQRGVQLQALSPMPELLSYWLPANDAQVLIRYINDEIARMVVKNPDRFVGLGGVPLQDVDMAIRELEYLMNDLKFRGVEIATHVNDVPIGDKRFEPFFAAAEKLGAAIFVHALRPVGMDRIVGPVSEQAMCFPGEIGLAAAGLITGGTAVHHPDLRIAFSHGGGVLSFLIARLGRAWDILPKMRETLPEKPLAYAKKFYYDSIVFDPEAMRHVMTTFGKSQVVAGSDFPFAMGDPDPVAFIRGMKLDAATERLLLADNAKRFLGMTK
jgi:aminocarboxymuconate-semialdehyde decarboxylase